MKESYQDIQKLLEQFMTAQEAGQMTDDIRQADSLLSAVPAAKVSQETLAAIQNNVHRHLASRHTRMVHIRIEKYFAAVAAMILIAVLSFVFFIDNKPAMAMDWNDDLTVDTKLANQFDHISGQMEQLNQTATQWLEDNSNLTVEVENLEQIASSTDFWKG